MVLLQTDNIAGLWIVALILVLIGALIRVIKNSAEKSRLKLIIEKLLKEFPSLKSFLEKGNSFELAAKLLKENENIPEIITIKYLTILTEETITPGIITAKRSIDQEDFSNRILLLNAAVERFLASMPDTKTAISEINEKKNIFYTAKQVVAEVRSEKDQIYMKNGILILGIHYLMFFPSSEIKDLIDFGLLEEFLTEATDKIPLLNFGILTAFVMKDIAEDIQDEPSLFTDKLKEKFLVLLNENKGFLINYCQIEKVHYAGVGKRIFGSAKFMITLNNSIVYTFSKQKDNLELIDTLFEKTLSLALMSGNLLLPENLSDKHNFISYYRKADILKQRN